MLMRGTPRTSVAWKSIELGMHRTKGRCSGVSVVAFGCSGRRLSRGVAQKVERWSADGKCTGKYDAEAIAIAMRKVAAWIGK